MTNWTDEIEQMVRVKSLVEEYDREELAQDAPPRPPADLALLRAVTDLAAGALDGQYAEFLRHADGWPGLLHSYDLFGTRELLGEQFQAALELISYLEPDVFEDAEIEEQDLFPIGMSSAAIDVFVTVTSAAEPRPVIWFAGLEVERFENFETFFRYMTEGNRKLAERLRAEANGR